jgi:Flp pilus assembly protein TadG
MCSSERHLHRNGAAQRGSALVEFALVISIFITLLLGAIDLSRWLYSIDAAGEAARTGARVAVVCNVSSPAVVASMVPTLVTVTGGTTAVNYLPAGCCASLTTCASACTGVQIRLTGYTVPRIAPFLPSMTIPPITTYLSRESMDSTDNARCS